MTDFDSSICLAAINAKYIHTNLAVRYIKRYYEKESRANGHDTVISPSVAILEFSINDSINNILKGLYQSGASIIAFSCYIWNIELVLKLCSSLKRIAPELTLILGGPEVSYNGAEIMQEHPEVDYIIQGEGEKTFAALMRFLRYRDSDAADIKGIVYRHEDAVLESPPRELISKLDTIPFPYADLDNLENKIIYYETSRGCPFCCQYCLSSTISGVRYFSMERIKADIDFFIEKEVKQVKLVDRTFNSNKQHCIEIMRYIIEKNASTNFHFEIAADLIDQQFVDIIGQAPAGMFQLEIGVQSTNLETLEEISRKMSFEKISTNVKKLLKLGNVHLHLDLIAGLPYEGYESFSDSFDAVYHLKPHMLQLGFLKLLKGSGLRVKAELYNISFHNFAPYEVISSKWLTYGELLKLKDIEHLVEVYYNSSKFINSLEYLTQKLYSSPFKLFSEFAEYWSRRGCYYSSRGMNELYTLLYEFVRDNLIMTLEFNERMKLDWLLYSKSGSMPVVIERYDHSKIKEQISSFIKDKSNLRKYIPEYEDLSPRELLKYVYYEYFFTDITALVPIDREIILFFVVKGNSTRYFSVSPEEIISTI